MTDPHAGREGRGEDVSRCIGGMIELCWGLSLHLDVDDPLASFRAVVRAAPEALALTGAIAGDAHDHGCAAYRARGC